MTLDRKLGNDLKLALFCGISANVLWGSTFYASKLALETWGPFGVSTIRFGIALVLIPFFTIFFKEKIRMPAFGDLPLILGAGLFGYGMLYPLQIFGLKLISSSLSSIIMLTSPLLILFVSALLGQTSLKKQFFPVLLGTFGGLFLVRFAVWDSTTSGLGILLTCGASLSLAISSFFSQRLAKQLGIINSVFWPMLVGLTIFVPFSYGEWGKIPTFTSLASILYLAIPCSIVAFGLWHKALALSGPDSVATTMHMKTPSAIGIGVVLGNETLSLSSVLSFFAVGVGVWLSSRRSIVLADDTAVLDPYLEFSPSLIVEATNSCDRVCSGCYAPNILLKVQDSGAKSAINPLVSNLAPIQLREALLSILNRQRSIDSISIRGGEPTMNPDILELVNICQSFSHSVYVETHARWLLEKSERTSKLLSCLSSSSTIVKMSFDSMHGLNPEQLKECICVLAEAKVSWVVAITEPTETDFIRTRGQISFIPNNKIISQEKAVRPDQLILPPLGIIGSNGKRKALLSNKLGQKGGNVQ